MEGQGESAGATISLVSPPRPAADEHVGAFLAKP